MSRKQELHLKTLRNYKYTRGIPSEVDESASLGECHPNYASTENIIENITENITENYRKY